VRSESEYGPKASSTWISPARRFRDAAAGIAGQHHFRRRVSAWLYNLLRAAEFAHPPGWTELCHFYAPRLFALVLSFIIAGVLWVGHHCRLARQPHAGRWAVLINLAFSPDPSFFCQ